ncbi:hypothetical protein C7212DRAFT_344855 [Tuber magnatum]|uniref:BZIP domain-containing protein n=1 Tax=Tuber magnatum TaxID=42249 RepID=A0A317SM05_9PEZI|nr:hypothetical protein C7212DRAFT_344855 [Tuber magnatum]
MPNPSVDPLLLSTFDSLLEHEDFLLSDSETVVSLFDNEPFSSTASNVDSDFTSPTDTNSPREAFTPGCPSSSSPQPEKALEADKKTEPAAKPVKKKRKSWGQELPTPTTNLPPRKRAKTDEEKEQRRIERVLRNRAAAQSSRERKRKEVQALEEERTKLAESNADMRARLVAQEETNKALCRELEDMQQTVKRYEQYMKAASNIAANATVSPINPLGPASYFAAPESTIKEEDNPFLFLDSSEASLVTTLNPVNLLSGSTHTSNKISKDGEPRTAHQSAELMCGLQCLRGDPTPEAWWGSFLTWIGVVLFMTLNISTQRSSSELLGRVEHAQRILHQMSIQQPFLLNLSSISNKLRTQLQQRIQTSNQALARLVMAATGPEMRLESAVEDAFPNVFQASSGESGRRLVNGDVEDSLADDAILMSAQSYLRDIKLSRITHPV